MSLLNRFETWISRTSLREQLETAVTVIAFAVGSLGLGTLMAVEYRTARIALLTDLQVQGEIFADNSSAAAAFMDSATASEVLAAMRSARNIASARLELNDGATLAEYRAAAEQHSQLTIWAEHVDIVVPVSYRGQSYGQLQLTGDLTRLNRRLALYSLAAFVTLILMVLLLRALFRYAVAVLMHPVSDLARLMRIVSEGKNYSLRSRVSAHNEIGVIAENFNQMLEQIENRDSALALELEERRSTEKRLAYLASHDTLTGLPNRHAFMQRLGGAGHLSLLLLDVDQFKLVNDSLGHRTGDHLLNEIAARLRSLQEPGVEVFRVGGDEFAMALLGQGGAEAAQRLADRVLMAMRTPFRLQEQELFTSFSIGIALGPEHATGLDSLLNCADLALYDAKGMGRDRWALFSPHLKAKIDTRLRLESDLRRALDRDEFFLVFEPQVNLATGVIEAAEALVRWRHPELGLMAPAEFIPVAEETGLIVRLGEWVLRRACLEGSAILRTMAPLPFRLAVNLSPRQLADSAIVGMVARVLAESGFPPASLELEVTESVMIEKLDLVSERMRALAALGVSFAMDDFGVGASSLSYLRRLPLSKIKIDRSFVRELPQNSDDMAVAAAITTLGHRLEIPVLAEGIETAEQLTCLQAMGCNLAQGYLFSRPKPLAEFIAHLTAATATGRVAEVPLQRPH